jgi:glycosyltransferase involved in cell wall biosynthesis
MRIGVNTLFMVPRDVGGTEVYLRMNLQEMSKSFPDHTFVLFTTEENDAVFRSDLLEHKNVEFRKIRIRAANRPVRIVAEQTILPIHAMRADLDVLWSPGYTAPFFSSCPQVVTIHDLQYLSFPEDMKWLERKTLDFLVRGACRKCCRILTVSQFSKDELVRHGFADSQKIDVVYEGVDKKFCRPQAQLSPEERKFIPPDTPYILCVAHTYPHKQVHLLVEAFGLIQNKIPHHLVLIGKARRGEDKVQEALKNIGERSRVHRFFGLEARDIIEVFHQADLFVLPSIYEGFGLPVLEAMIAGIPVVTTRSASIPEVGGDLVNYVKEVSGPGFAESIMSYLSLTQERKEAMISSATERAKKFCWRSSAAGIVNTLKDLK